MAAGKIVSNSGRFIQPQNFTKNKNILDIDYAKDNVKNLSAEQFAFLYGDVLGALSELVRPALIASEGKVFEVSDLAGIEARVVAWLSGEQWVLDAVAAGKDLYIVTAAMMFKIEEADVDDEGRQKGKICVLSLGYQGAVGAMMTMGAVRMGLCDEAIAIAKQECKDGAKIFVRNKKKELVEVLKYPEWNDEALTKACAPVLLPLIKDFRAANPNTVAYWKLCEEAVKACIGTREKQYLTRGMYCYYNKGLLFIHLPSGRELAYYHPRLEIVRKVETNEAGEEVVSFKETISYMGIDQEKKIWKKIYTYGGKIVENVTQAIARDIMCEQMLNMWDAGHETVLHVHDEVVNEKDADKSDISKVNEILAKPVPWAPGLPLAAKGFVSTHYKKD